MRPTSTSVRRFSFSVHRRFCVGSSPLRRRASRSPRARRFACRRKTLRRNLAVREALRRSAQAGSGRLCGGPSGRTTGRSGLQASVSFAPCRLGMPTFRLRLSGLPAASAAMNRMSGSVPCLGRNFSALSENRSGTSFVDLSGLSSRVVPSLRPGSGRVSVRDRPCGCRAMNIRSGCSDFRPFSVRRSVWPPSPFFDAPDRASLPRGAACRFGEVSPFPFRKRRRKAFTRSAFARSGCGPVVPDRVVRGQRGRSERNAAFPCRIVPSGKKTGGGPSGPSPVGSMRFSRFRASNPGGIDSADACRLPGRP